MKNIITRKINLKPQPYFNRNYIVFFHDMLQWYKESVPPSRELQLRCMRDPA